MNRSNIVGLGVLCAVVSGFGQIAGWRQPLLQPTIPPKRVDGRQDVPQWRVPMINPTIPPKLAGEQTEWHPPMVVVPQSGTNVLHFQTTNFIVQEFETSKPPWVGQCNPKWEPQLMYPSYPPKLVPLVR